MNFKNLALYQMYMEECESEFMEAFDVYLESVKKTSYYFKENLMPRVSTALSKSSNRDKIIDFTGKFIDDHSTQLLTSGPVYMFTFGDKEAVFLYNIFNITQDELLQMFNKMVDLAYDGEGNFATIKSSIHKILITAMIIESLDKNYTDIIECGIYLSIFATYPLVFRKFWPLSKGGVREDVMEYTIEHLSNQYIIKKQKNLLGALKHISISALESHKDRLKSGKDYEYIDYINRVRGQLRSAFNNIANQYYKNWTNNATLHTQKDLMADGKIVDNEGITTNIASLTENTYNKFLTNGVNASIAGAVANGSKVNKDNLISYLNKIFVDKNNKLDKFIENVIYLFLSNKDYAGSSVDSKDFMNFGLSLYRTISTSKVKEHQEIKSILDYWMDKIISIKDDYNRKATIINYRRATFNYFIFMIKYYN